MLLNAGGGFSNAGIQGEYYSSATALPGTPVSAPYGNPAFTRQDVRIDFNWGTAGQPGGSPDPVFASVSINNFSVLWSGAVIPKFSETYTFTATTVGGDVIFIRPDGSSTWTTLVNDWTVHGTTVDTATYTFTAGQTYDIEMQYRQPTAGAAAECTLQWSSPSTPIEAIEPATPVGINFDGGDAAFANMVNGSTRNYWWVPGNTNETVATDSNFWPTADAELFLGEGDITLDSGGTYLIQFNGTAQVTNWPQTVQFWVGTTNYGSTLPAGAGYSSSNNVTTARMVLPSGSWNGMYLTFADTSRDGKVSNPEHNGITNLYVMQPTTLGGSTDPQPGTLFTNAALAMAAQYDTLRLMGFTDTNGSLVSNWSDRTIPADEIWNGWAITGGSGVSTGDPSTAGAGVPWEVCIALANETGKDLYINIPSNASLAYITDLADLFAFGSDGVNAYTSPQADPVWAPLNSNLKVYIEFSNEIWNYGFSQAGTGGSGWINQLSQRAVYDYLEDITSDPLYPGGGANAYNDGSILVPYYNTVEDGTTWQSAFEATYNGTDPTESGYSSPTYFSNAASVNGYTIYQGWVALRLEQISTAFKTAFGETSINAAAAASRVRPVFEWQYGGSWSGELGAMQTMFPQPVDYYLYGGGAGWYSDDTESGFADATFADCNFATPVVSGTQADPAGTSWTFSNGSISGSTAGIAANGSSLSNPTAPTDGPPNAPGGSTQTAYLQPGASISESVDFSAGGWANITLLACETVADNYSNGLSISIDGTRVGESEGPWWGFSGSQGSWTWERTAAFDVTAGYHTVTFTNIWTSGGATVFVDDVAIQTVNSLFNETAAGGAPAITSVRSDVVLCLQYGLYDVGYEGGFDFNENLDGGDVNGYTEMGNRGYSSTTPNVGEMANLDPRTEALAVATLDDFYSYGGTLPIVFESSGNDNSWAVAAPTYFEYNTPKQQAAAAVEAALPPSPDLGTTVPATVVPLSKASDYDDSSGTLQTGGWIAWDIIVPVTGTYVFTATTTSGGSYSMTVDSSIVLGGGTSGGTIDPSATLTPGAYSFQVEATSGSFTVSQVVVSMAGAPTAPTITSSSLSGSVATLGWSSVSGASGYIIGYGSSAGQYTTFADVGNATSGSVAGLNPTAVDYFAVYAYNAGTARSLPSADVRLAPRSTDPSAYVNFADQAAIDNEGSPTPVTEPLVESGFAFTSLGNSGGTGLLIADNGNGWYPYPIKCLDAEYWGTYQSIARTDGAAFDLYSLELLEFQAGSAVITGYDISGGTVTQVVNLNTSAYASALAVLGWPDVVKVQITWWSGLNGSGSQHNGAITDVVFNDLPPTISSVSATPATVIGTSTALSVTAADYNPAVNPASTLLYTWAATTLPSGAAAPTFSANNSDAAQNTTAYFSAAGNYVFTVTVTDGCNLVATQTVSVTVSQTASGITITPSAPIVGDGGTKQLAAVVGDQFGTAMGTQPSFAWSIASGSGSVSSSGLFTAPSSGSGWTYVQASGGGYTGSGAVYCTSTVLPDYPSGFTGGSLTLAGSAALAGGDLRLTDSGNSDGATWYKTKLSTSSFATDFAFQISTVAGDYMGGMGGNGITFTIQNDAGNVVGSDAAGLGYQGITNSVALKFDLVPWDSSWASNVGAGNEELDSIGIFTDGAAPTTPATDLSMTGVQLRDGDVFDAAVTYNGTTLVVTLTDMTAVQRWSVTKSYAVNIPSVVGGSTAWFGFTGGSGGNVPSGSFQNILSWTVDPAPLTITANNQTMIYGTALPTLTASYAGFVNGDTPASLTTLPTLTTTATTSSPAGSYPITASGAADPNYTISYVPGTLTVTPVTWIGGAAGSWAVAANWSNGVVPTSATPVSIPSSGVTVTIPAGDTESAGSLTIAAGATLSLPGGGNPTNPTANLISRNAGFESPVAGNNTQPSTWGCWGSSYLSSQYAYSGSQSLLLSGTNSGASQQFTVTPGASYTASVYAMTPAGNPLTGNIVAELQLLYYNSSGAQISSYSAPNQIIVLDSSSAAGGPLVGSVGNQGWNHFFTTAVAPSNAVTARVQLATWVGSGSYGGVAYFDAVQFGPSPAGSSTLTTAGLVNNGTIAIGAMNTIAVNGGFTQTGTGTLNLQLGGAPASGIFGSLTVSGTAALAGVFASQIVYGYSPSTTDSFTPVTYDSEAGSFSNFQLSSGAGYQFNAAATFTNVVLSAAPTTALVATVSAATPVHAVSTNLLGINMVYWDPDTGTTQTKQMLSAAGLDLFRFPGGSASDDYHFDVADNYYAGAQTFAQFVQAITADGGTGLVTLDYGSGSPQEAAAELAYLDGSPTDATSIGNGIQWNDSTGQWQTVNWKTVGYWASLRGASPLAQDDGLNFLRIDHPTAFTDIKYWEVGNEEYGSWETDHHGTATPAETSTGAQHDPATYAAFAAQFAALAGTILTDAGLPQTTISIGIDSGDPTGASDGNWTENVLADGLALGFVPGFISDHSYMQSPGAESDSFLLNSSVTDSGSVLDWSTRYADYQAVLQATLGSQASSVQVLATEYNSVYTNPGKQSTSLVNGLFIAESLGSLLDSGYSGGIAWDLRNSWDTGENNSNALYGWREGGDYGQLGDPGDSNSAPATGPYVAYPGYYALQLASKIIQSGGQVVSATSNYSDLDVYAVKESSGDLALLVINVNPAAALSEQFDLTGFQFSGAAQVWQYGETQDTAQSLSSTGVSALASTSTSMGLSGSTFSYTFPAYSMTVLQLQPSIPPVVAVGNAGAVTFISGGAAVAVAPKLTISATSATTLASATVSISGGPLDAGSETLAANTAGTSITSSYNSATGVLTLSGSDTLAHYQQVLESVTYVDSLLGTTNLGNRTLNFSVTDANNLSSATVSAAVAFDVAPTVTGVYVSGSSWVTAYYNTLTSAGVGSSLGYELASGSGQLSNANVPGWTNLNTITIVFDKPVSGLTLSSFALGDSASNNNTGAGATSSGITITGETNVSSTEAQLTLSGPLPSNKYYVEVLATGVTDAAGATLDGLWTTSASTFAAGSGNGRRGATSFTNSMCWRVPSCATAGFRRRMSPSCGASRWGATRPPPGRTTSTATTG